MTARGDSGGLPVLGQLYKLKHMALLQLTGTWSIHGTVPQQQPQVWFARSQGNRIIFAR